MFRWMGPALLLVVGLGCGGALGPDCERELAAGGLRRTYDLEGPGLSRAREVVERRLEAAGVCAAVREADGRLVIDWPGGTDRHIMDAAVRPGHLRLRPTLPDERAAALRAELPPLPEDPSAWEGWLAAARQQLPGDVDVGIEPEGVGGPQVHLMPADGGLTDPGVRSTAVASDAASTRVVVRLDDAATPRFAELTRAQYDRPLVVELDGEILMAPVVRAPLETGDFSIEPGPSADPVRWCQATALVLVGPLPSPLLLATENVFRP